MRLLTFPTIFLCFSLALTCSGRQTTGEGSAGVKRQKPVAAPEAKDTPNDDLNPVELTARNFGKHVGDGNIWLIEFYSPNCVHCKDFAPTFTDIARHYHSANPKKLMVGKVNGSVERALTSRFSIVGFPSFFIVDGFQVYSFEQARSKKNMINFADGGYKKTGPLSFYESPFGPLGLAQGVLMNAVVALLDLFEWSQRRFGVSPLITGSILFGCTFFAIFFVIVFLAIVITPKVKDD